MAVPVLEGALDRSLELASSMDARGYGRRSSVPAATRRKGTLATGAGVLLVMVGVYDVLSASAPWGLGVAALVVGIGCLGAGLVVSGRRSRRTRYRPDVWRAAEWSVAMSGLAVVVAFSVADALGVAGLQVSFYPLAVPAIPLLACAGVLVGLRPAVVAPRPDVDPRSAPLAVPLVHATVEHR